MEIFFKLKKSLAEQTNKARFSLNKHFDKVSLNITRKLKLIDSMVLPILNYGGEMWGFHPAPNVEAVHLKFLKQLLKVRSQTSSAMVYAELGRVPLISKRKERILKYLLKIKSMTDTLLKNAYLKKTQMIDNNIGTLRINTWALEVKNMLNDLGFSYLWMSDNLSYGQSQIVIKRLNDQYIKKWFSDLSTMPKLCTYNMFKTDLTIEKILGVYY